MGNAREFLALYRQPAHRPEWQPALSNAATLKLDNPAMTLRSQHT